MSTTDCTTHYNISQKPILSKSFLNSEVSRSLGVLRGGKKFLFRLINVLVPNAILKKIVSPPNTQQLKKRLTEWGMKPSDEVVQQIKNIMGSKVSIRVKELVKQIEPKLSTAALETQPQPQQYLFGAVNCQFNLPRLGSFTPLFYGPDDQSAPHTAWVNAGALDLHIGGGGINKEFGAVAPFAKLPGSKKQFKQDLYCSLYDLTINKRKSKTFFLNPKDSGMKSLMLYPATDGKSSYAGSVGVYEYDKPPHNNPANQVMIYVVPSMRKKYKTDDCFLAAVEQTAKNLIIAYNSYAVKQKTEGKDVPVLRVCAFSAGRYAGSVPSFKIVNAIFAGIHSECEHLDKNQTLAFNQIQFPAPFDALFSQKKNQDKSNMTEVLAQGNNQIVQ